MTRILNKLGLVASRLATGRGQAMDDVEWKIVVANAAKWCSKNTVRMVFAPA